MVVKFVLNRGKRSIFADTPKFNQWYPRSKALDNHKDAEKQAWEMMRT